MRRSARRGVCGVSGGGGACLEAAGGCEYEEGDGGCGLGRASQRPLPYGRGSEGRGGKARGGEVRVRKTREREARERKTREPGSRSGFGSAKDGDPGARRGGWLNCDCAIAVSELGSLDAELLQHG